MPPRRSHVKTRTGCYHCKKKKIKCDEARPVCRNCKRYMAVCGYKTAELPVAFSKDVWVLEPSHSIPSSRRVSATASLQPLYDGDPGGERQNACSRSSVQPPDTSKISTFQVRDIELMYHYTCTTSLSICNMPQLQELFRRHVPQHAFKHKFLLHSLLALSALHMNVLNPGDISLFDLAFRHHQLSLSYYQKTLPEISKNNCDAVFACSAFIVLFITALGRGSSCNTHSSPLDQIIDVIMLRRGIRAVIKSSHHWLYESDVAPLFREFSSKMIDSKDHSLLETLVRLDQRNLQSLDSKDNIDMYSRAIAELHKWYHKAVMEGGDAIMAMMWPCEVEESFITALREKKPMALAVLAHFCVALHKCSPVWWLVGFGRRLVSWISDTLPDTWQPAIAWAKKEVGIIEDKLRASTITGSEEVER